MGVQNFCTDNPHSDAFLRNTLHFKSYLFFIVGLTHIGNEFH